MCKWKTYEAEVWESLVIALTGCENSRNHLERLT